MNEATPAPATDQVRCECGQLLARLIAEGVELKCKRCKRIHIIPWKEIERG